MKTTKGFNLKETIVVIVLTAFITSITTGLIVYNQNKLTKNITYMDLKEDESLHQFLTVYASLIDEYYEDVDKDELLNTAINAMFSYLNEDYSTYMSKEDTDDLANKLLGEYRGIGLSLNSDNEIVDFTPGGSAAASGLQLGDKIIKINQQDAASLTSKEIAAIITDTEIGSMVELVVERDNEQYTFSVESKRILIPALESSVLEGNIGYIKITTFSNTLSEQMQTALKDLEAKQINSLILDVRDNTGGYLTAASDVASMFLEKGNLIYSLLEKDKVEEYRDMTEEKRDYPMAILMNEKSASAAEVLIAALKDNGKVTTVGTVTYGKGKVQQTRTLDNGSMVKYTSARWLTPSGTCIDEEGITPDYEVQNDTSSTEDSQLAKAIEVVTSA